MTSAILTVDLDALSANWRGLASLCETETGAVVKADAYGLGAGRVARALARAGARRFFVAVAQEGASLRQALGPGPEIIVLSGHMRGDTDMIGDLELTPAINSMDQLTRHVEALPGHDFAVQLDTGMNRLGMEAGEWSALRDIILAQSPVFVMSHLACADEPDHPMNATQLDAFLDMTEGLDVSRSFAATGGILMGPQYHFDLTRPGIGLYGGAPFDAARPVAHLSVPVIQVRDVEVGESVGYSNAWVAQRPSRVATVAAGYADGVIRALGGSLQMWHGSQSCPVIGRISMDLITVDVTDLGEDPAVLDLLNAHQTVDVLAQGAGTIGYEILTSLGVRYQRRYAGA